MRSKFLLLLSLATLLSLGSVNAQFTRGKLKRFTKHERLQFTGAIGWSTYYGDLCDNMECMQFRPNFGIGAIYRILPKISLRSELSYYRLYSEDVYPDRNLNFRSGNIEFYVGGQYDLYAYTKHFRKRKKFQPYVWAGVGATYFNPQGLDLTNDTWVSLRELKTEGQNKPYVPVTVILPYGAGFRFKFRPKYDFIFEGGYRQTFTDYLDDVSGYGPSAGYPDQSVFLDPLAARMSLKSPAGTEYNERYDKQIRGNPSKNDGYFIFNAKVRYVIGAKNSVFKGKHPLLKPHHK